MPITLDEIVEETRQLSEDVVDRIMLARHGGIEPNEEMIQKWVLEARHGRDDSYAKLIETFAPGLQAIIYRMILDWDETRDVAQETFIQAYRALPRYRPDAKFQTWLFIIGARKALDVIRRRKRRPETTGLEEASYPGPEMAVEDRTTSQNEIILAIERAVQELPPDQRTAFVLAEYENYSLKDIANLLGDSVKSVEMHLYRARIALRERLKPHLQ